MKDLTKDLVLEIILKALPYADQITNIDTTNNEFIYFTWRHDTFQVSIESLTTMRIEQNVGIGDNSALLMQTLLKRTYVDILNKQDGE